MNPNEFLKLMRENNNIVIGEFAYSPNCPAIEEHIDISGIKGAKALNNYFVEIRKRERYGKGVQHFHVYDKGNPSRFQTCIKLMKPEYFIHGKYSSKFNGGEIKALINFLNTQKDPKMTYWDFIVDVWNRSHPDDKVPDNIKMPDYTKLPRRK